ncbi:MAG TPA: hypothetical protein VF771_13450 [Longimicrobiaceae bacterium]
MIQTATGAPSLRLAEWARRAGTPALQTMFRGSAKRKQRPDDQI